MKPVRKPTMRRPSVRQKMERTAQFVGYSQTALFYLSSTALIVLTGFVEGL